MLKVRDSNDDIKKIVFHVNPNFNLKLVCRAPLNRNPNMEVDKVANMVADMEVDMVADMEMDMVPDMEGRLVNRAQASSKLCELIKS